MPVTHFTATPAHAALTEHLTVARRWKMRDLFAEDPARAQAFSLEAAGLFLDYSKNRINRDTLDLLAALARECQVEMRRDAMFAGETINETEGRAALHTALRAPRGQNLRLGGQDVNAEVHAVLDRLHDFSNRVRSGAWLGYKEEPITDIVNIGIGGSDLGPKMACQALRAYVHPRIKPHFVSNVDGHDLAALLPTLNPATTLFIIASKTFTTAETMMNAQTARAWFLDQHPYVDDLKKHFVAVSTNAEAVQSFGIDPENMFPFWDWVGGRYSLWSAIGLPVMLAIGFERFSHLLAGAHELDRHFQTAPLERNMPVLLGLIGIWNRNYFNEAAISIAPYHQDLKFFPAYLQQLEMESNGKHVSLDGKPVAAPTCPIVWGDVGTNGQHAYFQLLHQGTDIVPVDFITALRPSHDLPGHHAALLANCFAQSEALMLGKSADEVKRELAKEGKSAAAIDALLPHKIFEGNRPSNTILLDELSPASLGALIALYEHKTFVQGVIWGVNSFDQWGVELGKVLAKQIQAELNGANTSNQHDSSTQSLIARARAALTT
ncbi:glucose-6-phosphate isomerase [Paucimonas lemoignei]|uniref:Glucose-6-phosphate isomerase n=1 Tax=Paucimonas lemoignei TaxID=29443 RepID=A0A4R3HS21_PAULE|nr:glucose-6-phosphate isomerase [Paucimonas lemoignei]TCS35728.1 glucose-6-phosphate isomerase [Paucimonas lemoignei]